jgi:hypothetical protein
VQTLLAINTDVGVEFSGNALTPCMNALDGSALRTKACSAKYLQDAEAVAAIFPSPTTPHLAGMPITLRHYPDAERLNGIYAALSVTSPNTRRTDAGAAVTPTGRGPTRLPCLPTEPCTGDGGARRVLGQPLQRRLAYVGADLQDIDGVRPGLVP